MPPIELTSVLPRASGETMKSLTNWWRDLRRPTVYSVTACANNGIASVVVVNGKSVQVEQKFQCCRPDCPFVKHSKEQTGSE
jgi:hypothetical protein